MCVFISIIKFLVTFKKDLVAFIVRDKVYCPKVWRDGFVIIKSLAPKEVNVDAWLAGVVSK